MSETCTAGFRIHVNLNPLVEVDPQLERRTLYQRSTTDQGLSSSLKSFIDNNSSLRIGFGWSFESINVMKAMIDECLQSLESSYGDLQCNLVTDMRGDWFAFMPYNTFERVIFEKLDNYELIAFNNHLCNFQIDMVKAVRGHKIYQQHLILKDTDYRYDLFKNARKNPDALSELFHTVIESLEGTLGVVTYPRQIIEEMVGCHFLYHPDTFFEILEFYKLKGMIYE
jgi:hypothetical protein